MIRSAFDETYVVSILTRPEGRVLLRYAGGYVTLWQGFNPHPARRPGATAVHNAACPFVESVSILNRPEGRVLRVDCV